MFTAFVRRTPPPHPEGTYRTGIIPTQIHNHSCTCTGAPSCCCSCTGLGFACPSSHGLSTAMPARYPQPHAGGRQLAIQYPVGGNIAYPQPITQYHQHQHHQHQYHQHQRQHHHNYQHNHQHNHQHNYNYQHHYNYHNHPRNQCPGHSCVQPHCVAMKGKPGEVKAGKSAATGAQRSGPEPCQCPKCRSCKKQRRKEEEEKWWSLAVPGKEGVVVGLACVIM